MRDILPVVAWKSGDFLYHREPVTMIAEPLVRCCDAQSALAAAKAERDALKADVGPLLQAVAALEVERDALRRALANLDEIADNERLTWRAGAFHFNEGVDAMLAAVKRAIAALGASPPMGSREPADPMDWPLPCDITVGNGTHRKGTKLFGLVMRMRMLFDAAFPELKDITPEQQAENLRRLQGVGSGEPGGDTGGCG